MRSVLSVTLCLAVLVALTVSAAAQGKEVTVTGKVTCAKCELNKGKDCATVVVANEGGKEVIYYLDEKSHKANHDAVCQGGKQGTVTGTVSEKGGKKVLTASKVELNK